MKKQGYIVLPDSCMDRIVDIAKELENAGLEVSEVLSITGKISGSYEDDKESALSAYAKGIGGKFIASDSDLLSYPNH